MKACHPALTRGRCLVALALALPLFRPLPLGSETLTLTTYYPAPYGGYAKLMSTGDTYLARDAGTVGIGTLAAGLNPNRKLEVVGDAFADNFCLRGNPGKCLETVIPIGFIGFFNLAACPAGWTELAATRGRYLAGNPAGGTLGGGLIYFLI